MSNKKVIAVVGATGAQGGGLVRAILNDPAREFTVRALTRKVDSDQAKALKELGAEIVFCDIDDVNSVTQAFTGAYGAFCITNFWEHFSAEKEVQQAANMANGAKAAGVKHVVWSTLEDTRKFIPVENDRMPTLGGKYNVPHFDGKGEADQEFAKAGVPTTYLLTSFYWDNFIYFGMGPQPIGDGKYAVTLPISDKKLPGIAVSDIGKCALTVFKRSDEFIGKTIGISGEHVTGQQMAQGFSKTLGKTIVYNAVEPGVYRGFGFPGADDLGNMFQFKVECNDQFCSARTRDFSLTLNPNMQTFEDWLKNNADRVPIPEQN